jgi:hypothetical protein
MIKIAITQAAFEAIVGTLPLGSVGYENKANEQGERHVWLAPTVVDRLAAMRVPGESYSDVILQLVKVEAGPAPREAPPVPIARPPVFTAH